VQYEKIEKKKMVEDKIYGFSLYASWTHFFAEVAQRRKLGGSKFSGENRKELEEIWPFHKELANGSKFYANTKFALDN